MGHGIRGPPAEVQGRGTQRGVTRAGCQLPVGIGPSRRAGLGSAFARVPGIGVPGYDCAALPGWSVVGVEECALTIGDD
jgi:hypothetical protein